MITNNFVEVYHRGVVAEHYLEKKKFMIWYHLDKDHGYKTIGIVQVRGIKELLTKEELKVFIDKLWERYHKQKASYINETNKEKPVSGS